MIGFCSHQHFVGTHTYFHTEKCIAMIQTISHYKFIKPNRSKININSIYKLQRFIHKLSYYLQITVRDPWLQPQLDCQKDTAMRVLYYNEAALQFFATMWFGCGWHFGWFPRIFHMSGLSFSYGQFLQILTWKYHRIIMKYIINLWIT